MFTNVVNGKRTTDERILFCKIIWLTETAKQFVYLKYFNTINIFSVIFFYSASLRNKHFNFLKLTPQHDSSVLLGDKNRKCWFFHTK